MNPDRKESVIIVAGGKGLRAGGELPKQFQSIGDMPMLMHTLLAFHRYNVQMKIVVVLPAGFQSFWEELCTTHHFSVQHNLVQGGETRFHSVKNGLALIADDEIVAVHDAARPFVSTALISRCFETAKIHDCGVIPVVEETNSVRQLTGSGSCMLDRKQLRLVQTPQVFPAAKIKRAYTTSFDPAFTDDASVVEREGCPILLVEGEENNFKITSPFDWTVAESWYQNFIKTIE